MLVTLPRWQVAPTAAARAASRIVAVTSAAALIVATATHAVADPVRAGQWWLKALHVTTAWATSTGPGVTVALLDTGADPTAPDLRGSVISGPDFTQSGRHAGGPYWGIHGTAMASLIAGHGHGPASSGPDGARLGADGIAGIAPRARILSIRVTLESNDPLTADPAVAGRQPTAIAAGIAYAVGHGATVIALPLDPAVPGPDGTPVGAGARAAAGGSDAERAAVAAALAKGVVLVAPAGDDAGGTDPVCYPAAYPGVISVGAFNSNFIKAPFSSRRGYVTLTAAGDGVAAAAPSGGYTAIRSTSAASAVVAGIAALIRSRYPALTPAQVTQALTGGTVFHRRGGKSTGSGYGTADAARALDFAAGLRPSAGASAAQPSAGSPRPARGPTSAAAGASPTIPSSEFTVGENVLNDGVLGLLVFLVVLLTVSLLAIARMPRSAARRPQPGTGEPAEISPQFPAVSQPWPPSQWEGGSPGMAGHGGGGYADAGHLMWPDQPMEQPPVPAAGFRFPDGDSRSPAQRPTAWEETARPPAVSGEPPWGPAPKPESEPPSWASPPS